ncbi:MAG: glycosyltransferase family 4 protein [Candidatus Aenigmarchaeota archaeon]|nr:glycosyltransferase family 4 protein [Candidatus Aenigmarchaeota archaeon]
MKFLGRKKKIKILVTHELFPPSFSGGGEIFVLKLVELLSNRKDTEVSVVTTSCGGCREIVNKKNVRIKRININRYLFNIFSIPRLLAESKRHDIIITNTYNAAIPSLIAAKINKKPIICFVHGAYHKKWFKMRSPILAFVSIIFEKILFNLPFDKLIFLSNYARKYAIRISNVIRSRGIVLHPGVDYTRFMPLKKKKQVLFIGRFEKQKGINTAIDVAYKMSNVKFVFIGRGRIDRKLPDNIKRYTFVPEKVLRRIYGESLIFMLPSVAEALGFVVLEAMASGCVIVSTVPLEYNGCFIEDNTKVDEFVRCIKKYLDNYHSSVKLGRKNREIVIKKYSWDKFIESLYRVIMKLLK